MMMKMKMISFIRNQNHKCKAFYIIVYIIINLKDGNLIKNASSKRRINEPLLICVFFKNKKLC